MEKSALLIDQFLREITYLRLSVTDRCDFRCMYCMAEDMTFLPRKSVLSLEELALIASTFRQLGVKKLRITGGEPLIRRDAIKLFQQLGQMGFDDLSLTTNGSQLASLANPLVDAGVHRINISLDTLKPDRFRQLTRTGRLDTVLAGIEAAKNAGFRRIKINAVILNNYNADEIVDLAHFTLSNGFDLSFIEEMPLGEIQSHQRNVEFIASETIRNTLLQHFDLQPSNEVTGGPSRYWSVAGKTNRIGFISPHSDNFCSTCNRVRVSAEGRLLLCLGNEHSVDLRQIMRNTPPAEVPATLTQAIVASMKIKPEKHNFNLDEQPQILRFMNSTGG